MELSLTVKAKLKLLSPNASTYLSDTTEIYRQACNFISEWIFNNDFELNSYKVSSSIYHKVREKFNLKSALAQSAIKTVTAKYKTVETQIKKKSFNFRDSDGSYTSIKKDLSWLEKPVYFNRPQADLFRNRDFSKLEDGSWSLLTNYQRVKAEIIFDGFENYLDGTWKFGVGKLLKRGNNWYFHISVTKNIEVLNKEDIKSVIGLDRGIRQLVTSYDEKGNTTFFSGEKVRKKREHYKKLRQSLQKRNTKSSKRRIRKLGQQENRWMTDVNHQLSKTLVENYPKNSLFVIENLEGVRFVTEKVNKNNRYDSVSWAFYQFEQFLIYKAIKRKSLVVKVSAQYTSQRCPKCGNIEKSNRNHQLHNYHCDKCNYQSNDDRIAAMNIQQLGTYYRSGIQKPKFEKLNVSA